MSEMRLIYIGSPQRAFEYAGVQLGEPRPRLDQVLAVPSISSSAFHTLLNLDLPSDCHIATELHRTKEGTHAAVPDATIIFEAALARRRRIDKAGT